MHEHLIGRDSQLARAAELIATAKSGSEAVFCLEAGPGMGKTVLAQRIAEAARGAGLLVLSGSFVDGQDLPPLWAWRRLLKKADRYLGRERDSGLLDIDLPWEQTPELSRLPEAERKYRFFELVSEYLHDLARRVPIALVLEDLHVGDDPSLRLLTYLSDALQFDAMFLLLTWRPSEGRGIDRIEELKRTVRFLPSITIASPAPFSRNELREYLSAMKIDTNDADLEQVHAWTDGVPLRAWLYARHVTAHSRPRGTRQAQGRPKLSDVFWDDVGKVLSERARESVRRLALLGNGFTEEEVLLVSAQADGETAESVLNELLEHGLLQTDSDRSTYRFFHDEFRVAVLESIDVRDLGFLIEGTAKAVRRTPRDARRTRLLKELYLSAVERGEGDSAARIENENAAIHYSTEAIKAARAQNAWREVVVDTERLLKLLEDRMDAATVLGLKVELCVASHYSRLRELFYNPMAAKLLNRLRADRDIDRYCEVLCNYHFYGYTEGFSNIDEHWEYLLSELAADDPRRGRVLVRYSEEQMTLTDDLQRSADILERAIAFAEEFDDAFTSAAAAAEMANIDVCRRRFDAALQAVEKVSADEVAMHTGSIRSKVAAARMLANLGLGRMDDARDAGRELVTLEKLYDEARLHGYAQFVMTRFPLLEGTWSRLELDASETENVGRSFMVLPSLIAAYLRGELNEADRFVSAFIDQSRSYGVERIQSTIIAVSWIVGARAYLTGDSRWVEETSAMVTRFFETERPPLSSLADLPVSAARMSRLSPIPEERARGLYALLIENDRYYFEEEEYTCAASKALLTLAWGEHDLAARHFEEAIALCDKYQERPWRAHYLFELALLLPPADTARAERLVSEASSEARRLGLEPLLSRMEREWRSGFAGDRMTGGGAAAGEHQPDALQAVGITRRERKILECLVEGLTDKEIAAALNISRYTVGNHLRNIYAKTQSSNRGEAAHWALAQGVAVVDRG